MQQTATEPKPNKWGVLPCPECGKDDFKASTARGLHRRQKHGVIGKSKSAIAMRSLHERQAMSATEPVTELKRGPGRPKKSTDTPDTSPSPHTASVPNTTCTHCDPSRQFASVNGLKIHLSQAHGILGAVAAKKAGQITDNALTLPPQRTSPNGTRNGHNNESPQATRSTEPPLTGEDLALFQALGEVRGLCRSLAESAGIPTSVFTARVALALHSQTRGR